MLRIRRILRDYEDAGSLNSLIALWGFVEDCTFLTKAGHLGLVYRLAGVDFECLDHVQRRDITKLRFAAWTTPAAFISTSPNAAWNRSHQGHAASRSSTKPFIVGPRT